LVPRLDWCKRLVLLEKSLQQQNAAVDLDRLAVEDRKRGQGLVFYRVALEGLRAKCNCSEAAKIPDQGADIYRENWCVKNTCFDGSALIYYAMVRVLPLTTSVFWDFFLF
jgi:hypothetical protein